MTDTRVDRERSFHDSRFARGGSRGGAVGRFYLLDRSIRQQYWALLANSCQGLKALGLGCGVGGPARELARMGAEVTAIDISPVAIDVARRSARQAGVRAIRFEVMDAERLIFADNTFDLVYGAGILHHLQLEKALSEVARVLSRTGKAVFIEPLGHNPLINAFRRLTPGLRSIDEHPLLERDLLGLQGFRRIDLQFFYLCALAAIPLAGLPGFGRVLWWLEALDGWLFRYRFFRRQAWQVLIVLSDPAS